MFAAPTAFAIAVTTVAGSIALIGGTASAEETDGIVVASLSADPTDSTDSAGEQVELVQMNDDPRDSGETLALVRTQSGNPALVTTQFGAPRSVSVEPTAYPTRPESAEPEAIIEGDTLTRTEYLNFEDIPSADPAALDVVFVSAVTNDSVSFAWAPVDGAAEYVISRDGVEIARTVEFEMTDVAVKPSTSYTYEIIAVYPRQTSLTVRHPREPFR